MDSRLIYMIDKEKLKELCIKGLLNEGESWHQTYFFERILIELGYNLDDLQKELEIKGYTWDRGIPP